MHVVLPAYDITDEEKEGQWWRHTWSNFFLYTRKFNKECYPWDFWASSLRTMPSQIVYCCIIASKRHLLPKGGVPFDGYVYVCILNYYGYTWGSQDSTQKRETQLDPTKKRPRNRSNPKVHHIKVSILDVVQTLRNEKSSFTKPFSRYLVALLQLALLTCTFHLTSYLSTKQRGFYL